VNLFSESRLNHHASVVRGILADECGYMLTNFFNKLR
jgi:tRNA(adenine34) deaminase